MEKYSARKMNAGITCAVVGAVMFLCVALTSPHEPPAVLPWIIMFIAAFTIIIGMIVALGEYDKYYR